MLPFVCAYLLKRICGCVCAQVCGVFLGAVCEAVLRLGSGVAGVKS